MKKLLTALFAGAKPTACESCKLRQQAMVSMDDRARTALRAQSVANQRIAAFSKDHPELWRAYFTKAGEQARLGVKV